VNTNKSSPVSRKSIQLLEELSAAIEAGMHRQLDSSSGPLYDMVKYQLGWISPKGELPTMHQSKRNLGSFCLFTSLLLGGSISQSLPVAIGIELAAEFNQIHHAIQQGDPKTDSGDTLWWLWGPAQAINAGDGMHILSRLSLNRLTENGIEDKLHLEALRTLDQSILTHCEGQYLYLNFQERIDITVKQYMAMAEKKEGSFLSAALQLASLTATSTQHRLGLLETIGVQLGIAKQISSDLSFLSSAFDQDNSSVLISEIANKNKLLPVVYAIETGTLNQKRKLGSIYFKKFLEKDDMTEIQTVLSDTHAIEYSTKVRSDLLQQSLEELIKIEYNKDMGKLIPSVLEIILSKK
tara:strand:- start:982 stop:2037 length:1056 start_codon:yes stop_codon:yes gene_type:complete